MNLLKKIQIAVASLVVTTVAAPYVTSETHVVEATMTSQETSASIANYIAIRNNNISYDEAKNISDGITYYSAMYGVDPLLMTALFETESNFNQSDISSTGAIGIGQIMPDTAVLLGVNPYDTMQNIQGACSYMSTALQTFSNWQEPAVMALAAYNAGTQAVIDYNGVPPFLETQNYVVQIRNRYWNLRNLFGDQTIEGISSETDSMGEESIISGDSGDSYIEYVEQDTPVGEVLDEEDY